MTRQPYQTPAAIRLLAHKGYGVDDIRVMSGWRYTEIAKALGREERLRPFAKLAVRRALDELGRAR